MRKITPEPPLHNGLSRRRALRLGIAPMIFALALTACSPDPDSRQADGDSPHRAGPDCPVTTDTSAWDAFTGLADRIATGEKVPQAELDSFGDLPTVALWRRSLQPGNPSAQRVGNWLEATFWEELGRSGNQKRNADRADFERSYRYSLTYRDRIAKRLETLTGTGRCAIDSLSRFWVAPPNMPSALTVRFLPAKPEIRIFEGDLLVDTGVVGAVNTHQLTRQLASLLYRKYQFVPGENPLESEGELAVAHMVRTMMNEGMAGWIEQSAHMYFDPEHPKLYKVRIIPEDFFLKAQEVVDLLNRYLGPMLEDEADMAEKGPTLARQFVAMNAYGPTGYAMCAVIASRLGEGRLRDAGRSVPLFLAAYQEAALRNEVPVPLPGTPGTELYMTVKALDPSTFSELKALLGRVFPE